MSLATVLKPGLAFPAEALPLLRSLFETLKPRRRPQPPHVPDPHEAELYDDLFYLALVHRYW